MTCSSRFAFFGEPLRGLPLSPALLAAAAAAASFSDQTIS